MRVHSAWKVAITASCLAAALGISAAASAQTIYRQVDAAGHVIFTDRPDAELRVSTRFLPPSGRSFDTSPLLFGAAPPDARSEVEHALSLGSAIASQQSLDVDLKEAARRLKQAKLNREQGARANPGEEAAGARAVILNERYWQRQQALQRQVDMADRRYARSPR